MLSVDQLHKCYKFVQLSGDHVLPPDFTEEERKACADLSRDQGAGFIPEVHTQSPFYWDCPA